MPRSQQLLDAIKAIGDAHDVVLGLEGAVGNDPTFTFMAWHPISPEVPIAQDVRFRWTPGSTEVLWWLDISIHEDTNPASFWPHHGYATWGGGPGLLVVVVDPDNGRHGVAYLPDDSPTDDTDDPDRALRDPERWVGLARSMFRACVELDGAFLSATDAPEFAVGWRWPD